MKINQSLFSAPIRFELPEKKIKSRLDSVVNETHQLLVNLKRSNSFYYHKQWMDSCNSTKIIIVANHKQSVQTDEKIKSVIKNIKLLEEKRAEILLKSPGMDKIEATVNKWFPSNELNNKKVNQEEIFKQYAREIEEYKNLFREKVDNELFQIIEVKNFLSRSFNLLNEIKKDYDPKESEDKKVIKEIDQAIVHFKELHEKLGKNQEILKKIQNQFTTNFLDPNTIQLIKKLLGFYQGFINDPETTVRDALDLFTWFMELGMKHPCKKVEEVIANAYLVYREQFYHEHDDTPKSFAALIEKKIVSKAFLEGYSNKELPEDPQGMTEAEAERFEQVYQTLKALPKLQAAIKGASQGSMLPFDAVSKVAKSGGEVIDDLLNLGVSTIPYLSSILEIVGGTLKISGNALGMANIVLGVIEQCKIAQSKQDIDRILSEDQKRAFLTFYYYLEESYNSYSELQRAVSEAQLAHEVTKVLDGNPSADLFSGVKNDLKEFALKLKHAGNKERAQRILLQVILPLAVFSFFCVGIAATIAGISPVGVVIVATVVGSTAAFAGNLYLVYQIMQKLNYWLDNRYDSTVKKVREEQKLEKDHLKLKRFLEENNEKIEGLIRKSTESLEKVIQEIDQSFKEENWVNKDSIEDKEKIVEELRKTWISLGGYYAEVVQEIEKNSEKGVDEVERIGVDLTESKEEIVDLAEPRKEEAEEIEESNKRRMELLDEEIAQFQEQIKEKFREKKKTEIEKRVYAMVLSQFSTQSGVDFKDIEAYRPIAEKGLQQEIEDLQSFLKNRNEHLLKKAQSQFSEKERALLEGMKKALSEEALNSLPQASH